MFLPRLRSAFLRTTLCGALLSALAACGGGGGQTPPPTQSPPPAVEKASVTVLFTDAPSDAFDQIFVTITSIALLGGDGPQVLFEGEETIDLLQLESFSDLFAVADDIEPGSYDKIRLRVTDLELVRLDEDGNVAESFRPDLPANGKIDLNPRGSFDIAPGENLLMQIDLDARRSIHVVGTGNGRFRFRPVVFVEVLTGASDGKKVRINGVVTAIDADNQRFEVCQRHPASSDQVAIDNDSTDRHCVTVAADDGTGVFDSDGIEASFALLMVDDAVSVIGTFAMAGDQLDDARTLIADVVMLGPPGTFQRIKGTALGAVDAVNRFDFEIGRGQGFASGSVIAVWMQPASGIVDKDGEDVGADLIQADVPARVDGVIALDNVAGNELRAAFVVLDLSSDTDMGGPDEIELSGELLGIDAAAGQLTLATGAGDRCIAVGDQTRYFQITTDSDGTQTDAIELADLTAGSTAEVFGLEGDGGCFVAAVVIVAAAG